MVYATGRWLPRAPHGNRPRRIWSRGSTRCSRPAARWRGCLPGFEPRPAQRAMAATVAAALQHDGVALVEAGTGTGKTIAYLIPAILSGKRVLVSTGTKNLQEQIVDKDLPVLTRVLDRPFTATVMKGRSNYLCLHRYQAMRSGGLPRQQRLGGLRPPGHRSRRADPAADSRALGRQDDNRRPGRAARFARGPADLVGAVGVGRELPRHDLPAVQRVLRHADAAASRRFGPGDRQPPPAVCRRRGAPGQLRRRDSGSRRRDSRRGPSARGCRHQLLRLVGEQLSDRRPDSRHRTRAGRAGRRPSAATPSSA